jgi:hypothetical protein
MWRKPQRDGVIKLYMNGTDQNGQPMKKKQEQNKLEEEMAEGETYFWFSCAKVCLDKDLANTNVLTHVTHSLFHGLSRS